MGDDKTQNATFYAPFEKADDELRMVYGYASTEAEDSQGEKVNKQAMTDALDEYMKFANIREMHQPSAVGVTKQANIDKKGLYVAAHIVDDNAWKKVKAGVYKGFSIGGRVMQMVDNQIEKLKLSEISLVDRPANPEAIFDVFKLDKNDKPLLSKDISVEVKVEDVKKDDAVIPEVKEEIVTPEIVVDDKKPDATVDVAPDAETKEVDAKVEDVKEETTEDEEPKTDNEDEKTEDEKTDEEDKEEKTKEVAEQPTDIEKAIAEKINEGKMPSRDEIIDLMRAKSVEVTDASLEVMKYELAGTIIKNLETSISEGRERDAATLELNKIQAKIDWVETQKNQIPTVGGEPHQFDKVFALVKKLEGQLQIEKADNTDDDNDELNEGNHGTNRDVDALPASNNADLSTQFSLVTSALTALNEAVAQITAQNGGGNLSDEEKALLTNGVKAGSTVTGGGHLSDPNASNQEQTVEPPTVSTPDSNIRTPGIPLRNMEENQDLLKVEGLIKKIEELENKVKILEDTPLPIKAHASYQVVEKVFGSNNGSTGDELQKAEAKTEELHKALQEKPYDQGLIDEANTHAALVMRLRRESQNASNN